MGVPSPARARNAVTDSASLASVSASGDDESCAGARGPPESGTSPLSVATHWLPLLLMPLLLSHHRRGGSRTVRQSRGGKADLV